MSMTKNKVSVIVVNYNSTNNLNILLKSLSIINNIIGQIIIIDNNSNDIEYLDKNLKKIILIKNKKNVGFSRAVNQAIKIANNNYLLLINPDCCLIDNSPKNTFDKILNNNNIGAIGGSIISMNNKHQYTATSLPTFLTGLFEFTNLKKIFPNNIYSNKFWIEKNYHSKIPTKVHSLCGAYIFFRKYGLNSINLFDQKYFLYLEDLDFGTIINNNCQETWFDPQSQITHIGGSSNKSKYKIVLKYWYKSRKYYFLKHLPKYQGYTLYIIFSIEELLLKIYHSIIHTPND